MKSLFPRVHFAFAVLSIVISLLLWVIVFSETSKPFETRTYMVELEPDALAPNKFAVTRLPATIPVTTTLSADKLERLRPETFKAYVDLSKATAGERTYPVQVFPPELRQLLTRDLSVRVGLEPIESKFFVISIETKGSLPDKALKLGGLSSNPVRAQVSGPRSAVAKAAGIRAIVDLSQVDALGSVVDSELVAVDDRGNPLDQLRTNPLFARIRVAVQSAPQEKRVLVVPNFAGSPAAGVVPGGYTVSPSQLTVVGPSQVLAGLSKVETENIDITNLKTTKTFSAKVRLPGGVKISGASQVTVVVRINSPIVPPPSKP